MTNKFTRRHYEEIAAVLRACHPMGPPWAVSPVDRARTILAMRAQAAETLTTFTQLFQRDNPNFDTARFVDACTPAGRDQLVGA